MGRVKVAELLLKYGVIQEESERWCSFCGLEIETMDHLFLHCGLVNRLWIECISWWGISWVIPPSVYSLPEWWVGTRCNKATKVIWDLIPHALIWLVWKWRNRSCFENHLPNWESAGDEVKSTVVIWAKSHASFNSTLINDIVFNLQVVI